MALTQEKKKELVKKFGANDTDTGNAKTQIAIFSTRISELTEHLKLNKKDFACQRGLLILVGKRRRLMNYVKATQTPEAYKELLTSLNLRK